MAKHCQSFLSIRLESIESNLFELNFVVVYVELPNKGEWNTELSLQKLVLTGANKGPRNFNLLHLSEALPNWSGGGGGFQLIIVFGDGLN